MRLESGGKDKDSFLILRRLTQILQKYPKTLGKIKQKAAETLRLGNLNKKIIH